MKFKKGDIIQDESFFGYYCPKCNRFCDFDEEVELREDYFEGNWQEFHIDCDSKVHIKIRKEGK